MKIIVTNILLGFLLSAVLAACSSDDSSCSPVTLSLEGAWLSNCVVQGGGGYRTTQVTFIGNTVSSSSTIYSDAACSAMTGIRSPISGAYTTGCAVMTGQVPRPMNWTSLLTLEVWMQS